MLRIISGEARGRKIDAPPSDLTRPLTDRARESMFNVLFSLGGVEGKSICDVFAGSGSFGLECLSRGASQVTFVEKSPVARKILEANIEKLGFGERSKVVTGTAESFVTSMKPCDLAFCDPPYALDPWPLLLDNIQASILVGHAESDVDLGSNWEEIKRKKYGRARIFFARPSTS